MKKLIFVMIAMSICTAPAMANQGCAIDDGDENIVDDMPFDPTPSKMNWLVLKTNYKGYEIKAIFTDKTSGDAVISATKDGVVMSAAGIQLSLKDASGTTFVVTCGN